MDPKGKYFQPIRNLVGAWCIFLISDGVVGNIFRLVEKIIMKILSQYIVKDIVIMTGIVLLALIGVQLFIQFAAELQDIGTNHYVLLQAIIYVPLLLPGRLYEFFPMAALIGTLMGLGRLATHSEERRVGKECRSRWSP